MPARSEGAEFLLDSAKLPRPCNAEFWGVGPGVFWKEKVNNSAFPWDLTGSSLPCAWVGPPEEIQEQRKERVPGREVAMGIYGGPTA